MALIDPVVTTEETVSVTLKNTTTTLIDAYVAFFAARGKVITGDAVIESCVLYVCEKDRELQTWKDSLPVQDGDIARVHPASLRAAEDISDTPSRASAASLRAVSRKKVRLSADTSAA